MFYNDNAKSMSMKDYKEVVENDYAFMSKLVLPVTTVKLKDICESYLLCHSNQDLFHNSKNYNRQLVLSFNL
jgi:hypothetical protein